MGLKKKGLGRGLDSLLGTINTPIHIGESKPKEELRSLSLEQIQCGKYQPRVEISSEALAELADSIRAQGVIQPIIVRSEQNGIFELIAGERRWRAAQIVGLREIPALVKNVSDQAAAAIALIENIQREDLNAIEQATAYQKLINEFNMTHQEIAQAVGCSRASISNLLRLLTLNGEIKSHVEKGDLEMGHARALLSLDDAIQRKIASKIIQERLSVRDTENLVRRMQQESIPKFKQNLLSDPDIRKLEEELAERLGTIVQLQHLSGGKGRILIRYHSMDELDGILTHIK
ncbi:ParB/RepB/Spo0J family partition protein [Candidatus Nitrosacidococcus tergens]|uniref:Probable chromosome-partitioning protein ParB n=1 Tax=Candidatus Nitrosacidococcus tergens TaxID=553981 RepID=A0A7G1QBV2_9GAMM|nr:ParB/RepB/Spo0J family partition protein [Candidatus Nitrosacidococcus tergens]CAB1277636.1 putative chromosome-partitioning protein ParB [Candidatus Nitrosacidococcus tergens]